jgi:hypothetical protein
MDQSGNNHLLLRANQAGPPDYNGQHAATDRMRELLARTVHDHIIEERSTAAALQDIRQRLAALDGATAIAATLDGLAASLGALDSKLTARLERLDERLDDQYDRVRAIDAAVEGQTMNLDQAVAKAVEAASGDIMARIASLEDTLFTLAEALLRPSSIRLQDQSLRLERTRAPSRPASFCFAAAYSHSMVPGGLLVMSSVTRLTSRTSLVIRVEIRASRS